MEHGERQRNEHHGRSSSAILKNGVYHYEKELPQNLNCLLSWIYHAGNFCKFCTFTISYLSQNLPYFSWKNCVYLDNILFHTDVPITKVVFLYENKNNQELKEFVVERNITTEPILTEVLKVG